MASRILSFLDATARDRARIEKALRSGDTECVRKEREIAVVLDLIKTQEFELRSNAYRAMKNFAEAYPPISDAVGSALVGALVYENASSKDLHDILSLLEILATKPERLGGFSPAFKIRENAGFVLDLLNSSKSWRIEQAVAELLPRLDLDRDLIERELLKFLTRKHDKFTAGHALSALAKLGGRNSIDTLRKFATKAKTVSEVVPAIWGLGRLQGAAAQDVYLHALTKRSNAQLKQIGLRYMLDYGDNRAVAVAVDRIKKILAKPTYSGRFMILGPSESRPELVDAFLYLGKHSPERERELLAWAWFKKRAYLDEPELEFVTNRVRELTIS